MPPISVQCNSQYACHIAYMSYLLKLDVNIISPSSNKTFTFAGEYQSYYQRMIDKLYEQTNYHLEATLFEWFIKNMFPFYSSSASIDITLTSITLKDSETEFLEQLFVLNMIPVQLAKYEIDFTSYTETIQWAFQQIFGRPPTQPEINYHYINNGLGMYNVAETKFINLFSWLHLLYFGVDGQAAGIHMPWINAFKPLKLHISLLVPKVALLLSGHSRDFMQHSPSHRKFIENPYIDIFIHTWQNKGPRYEYVEEGVNLQDIINTYKPSKYLVEDEHLFKNIFSLRGRSYPIFLMWGQQGDDASRYVNASLYSTWKALNLMKDYEQENGITYDAIIKMNFNIELTHFEFKKITEDISPNMFGEIKNALYVPSKHYNTFNTHRHPYSGGGCARCDVEAKYIHYNYVPNHPYHLNDISDAWFYANRLVGLYACDLYLHAEQIMIDNHASNLANYPNVRHKTYGSFIYIQEPVNYQAKVYDVDDVPKRMVCFYPERLLREYMKTYPCLSSSNIHGTFTYFDVITKKIT